MFWFYPKSFKIPQLLQKESFLNLSILELVDYCFALYQTCAVYILFLCVQDLNSILQQLGKIVTSSGQYIFMFPEIDRITSIRTPKSDLLRPDFLRFRTVVIFHLTKLWIIWNIKKFIFWNVTETQNLPTWEKSATSTIICTRKLVCTRLHWLFTSQRKEL